MAIYDFWISGSDGTGRRYDEALVCLHDSTVELMHRQGLKHSFTVHDDKGATLPSGTVVSKIKIDGYGTRIEFSAEHVKDYVELEARQVSGPDVTFTSPAPLKVNAELAKPYGNYVFELTLKRQSGKTVDVLYFMDGNHVYDIMW